MPNVYLGTSGFSNSFWKGPFYPIDLKSADFLHFYGQHLSSVEINSTFYHVPRKQTVENWLAAVPKDFIFAIKANQHITHEPTVFDEKMLAAFFAALEPMAKQSNKHVILLQFPGRSNATLAQLETLFQKLPSTFRYAAELRNPAWFKTETYALLQKYGISLVLSDNPPSKKKLTMWPKVDQPTADFSYIRLHGAEKLYYSSYTEEQLIFYTDLVKSKITAGSDVFCYFNNTASVAAIENIRSFQALLKRALKLHEMR